MFVSARKWLSLKGKNPTAEGNALGNQTTKIHKP
jgi:hypothetical protein